MKYRRRVNSKDVIKQIRQLAKESPDENKTAVYVDPKTHKPVCIVGEALYRCGIDPERLDVDQEVCDVWHIYFMSNTPQKDVDWIMDVQVAHDTPGSTWSEAVRKADNA